MSVWNLLLANKEEVANEEEEEEKEEEKQVEGDVKVEHEETEQESQKENDRKEEEDDDVEEAKAKENEPAKEKTEAEKQDEDHEKVEHEDQKQQTQKEKDLEEVDEEDDEDAKETDKERVKEVTENADAKMHQHEEREGAEQPVTKRGRTLNQNTSDEVWPPKKVNKCSLLSPETRSGLDLVDRGADTAAGLGEPPATEQAPLCCRQREGLPREQREGLPRRRFPAATPRVLEPAGFHGGRGLQAEVGEVVVAVLCRDSAEPGC
jgi:hypothetical protein